MTCIWRNVLKEKFKIKKSSYSNVIVTEFKLSFLKPKTDTSVTCDVLEENDRHN